MNRHRQAFVLTAVFALLAACGCATEREGRPSGAGPAPIPNVAWGGIGVDVGHPGNSNSGGGVPLAGNIGMSVGGPEGLAALACCLGYMAFSEILRSSNDDASVVLVGGREIWETMRSAADDEFVRGVDEELQARVKSVGPPPPDRPPPGTDVVMTGEIGPARRAGPAAIVLLVRLLVKDRSGRTSFREERWTRPFTEPLVWDDRARRAFRSGVSPTVDELMRAYRLTLSR